MRIVAGKYRGRKLSGFDYDNIRPTSDNVKEAVFNKIQYEIDGSMFLDLFGGTGNVGIEAESRGANVVICDNNKNSIKLIKKNIELLGGQAKVLFNDYEICIKKLSEAKTNFDIIYVDPPYEKKCYESVLDLIVEYDILKKDGLVILEMHKKNKVEIPNNFNVLDERIYGIKRVVYLEGKFND